MAIDDQEYGNADCKYSGPDSIRQTCSQAQERALVFRILQSNRVLQVGLGRRSGQMHDSQLFRDAVTAYCRYQKNKG